MCGLMVPTGGQDHRDQVIRQPEGQISVLRTDPAREHGRITERVGYLSQRFSLYPDLTIDENIQFFAEIHGVRDYQRRRDQLLDMTQLTRFRGRLADKLSGGMKQKLALACTLVHGRADPRRGRRGRPVSRRGSGCSRASANGITILIDAFGRS
jgi:ABC-type lipoprotein export system ATPase subunit